MARAFEDLLVQETDGKPRLTFRSRQGTAVLEDVSVEVASPVLRQGDRWGALAANTLLELDDNGVPQAVAPEFTPAAKPAALAPRERMSAAFGKLAAAVTALTAHLADGVKHITAAERNAWNGKADLSAMTAAIAQAEKTFLLAAHPVGSYYWSSNATSPATLFGGTWTQITGRFVYAADSTHTVGTTGGAETVALTPAQMPKHTHDVYATFSRPDALAGSRRNVIVEDSIKETTIYHSIEDITASAGSGSAHDNMPPYIAAYCWRRTA